MIRTLVLAGPEQAESLQPWLDYLGRTGEVSATVRPSSEAFSELDGVDVVVAHAPDIELDPDSEARLCDFLQAGGGMVGLHCTNSCWAGAERYLRTVGGSRDGRLAPSELVTVVKDPDHDITRRLAGGLTVHDSCYTQAEAPEDCRVLLETTWRASRLPVAYVREAGRGRVFYLGLGESDATFGSAPVQDLLYRGLRYAAGKVEPAAVGIGMLGFGAIGPEHAEAMAAVAGLELRAVCDRSPVRVQAALALAPAATAAPDIAELTAADDVDLIVISTPPNTHAELVEAALRAGKHVVVEKPFCLKAEDADRLIGLAEDAGRTLTVYQNRRWDADFLALQEAVQSGELGHIFHLESFVGGFSHPCHFWHSDASVSGGVIYDWGSHYLDWILQLMPGEVVQVSATRQKLIWHDVTNDDHFQLRLRFADGAEAEFVHSDIAAARKPKWYVLGTKGAAVGYWREGSVTTRGPGGAVIEERLAVTDRPCELHLMRPNGAGDSHDQRLSLPDPPPQAFYRNLAGHLLAGEPLAVPARSARRNVAVMEAATTAAREGRPVTVSI